MGMFSDWDRVHSSDVYVENQVATITNTCLFALRLLVVAWLVLSCLVVALVCCSCFCFFIVFDTYAVVAALLAVQHSYRYY